MNGWFSNAWIAYRALLTISVTVASGEWSFSKLKFIKTYLGLSMSQERLNWLAMLSNDKQIAAKIDYASVITTLAAENARRVVFKWYCRFL